MRNVRLTPLGLALAVAACNPAPQHSPAPSPSPARKATAPSLHITGHGTSAQPVRIVQQKGNRVQYQMIAQSFESRGPQGRTRAVFSTVHVTFHDKDGSTLKATAPQAIVNQTTNTISLRNGVTARTASGVTLQCEQLVYDRRTEMLAGTGNVVITDPKGFRATGSRFDSDISLTHIHMK